MTKGKKKEAEFRIGSLLKSLLKDSPFSQRKLSQCVGISETQLSRIFSDKQNSSFDTIKKILDCLGYNFHFVRSKSYEDWLLDAYSSDPEMKEALNQLIRNVQWAKGQKVSCGNDLSKELISILRESLPQIDEGQA